METSRKASVVRVGSKTRYEQWFILANHWKSDLEFFEQDLHFLHHLIDNYLLWITLPENMKAVRAIGSNLESLRTACRSLLEKVDKHKELLAEQLPASNSRDQEALAASHASLEQELASFVKKFRQNRLDTFKVTEYIIDSEELPEIDMR